MRKKALQVESTPAAATTATLEKEAEVSKTNRKAAPAIRFPGVTDQRKALVDKLDKENPDFVHMYQSGEVTDWELDAKGQEIVRDEKGRVLHHMGDPVVRMSRAQFEADRKQESDRSLNAVKAAVKVKDAVQFRSPKRPPARPNNTPETDK